jgi:aminoglycoside phosphotransferase (APT) family kinase protein
MATPSGVVRLAMGRIAVRTGLDEPQARMRIERFLCREAAAGEVTIDRVALLSGGTIQENWSLGVRVHEGPMAGEHRWVVRTATIAVSLTRAQEFAVLRVAHRAGVATPWPLWLCTDPGVIGREFFVMERVTGISAGHRLTKDANRSPSALPWSRRGERRHRRRGIATRWMTKP